ncbi:MAG: J domain-containing protein [Clostridiales bacterium]|nr:J domain-containing protein [Clostridiales bacterium]
MSEIVNMNKSAYDRYEELLLRKSALKKECFQLEQEYTRLFGEAILKLYRLQIECAKKKKTIEFCQAAVNRGEEPDERKLQEFILKETRELQEHFRKMSEEYEVAKSAVKITEADLAKIRKIYRRTVKLLHPDIHPEVAESEDLKDLWNRVSVAYACNDLKELEELEVLVAAALADRSGEEWKVEVPDLDARISSLEGEIEKITGTDPYQYKFLFDDPEAVEEKKRTLQGQIGEYTSYAAKLDEILASVLPEGMIVVWDSE